MRSPRAVASKLVEIAREARLRAYAPYSRFLVGAALLGADGRIFTGCNVENGSYGATICAERTALVKAVSEGCREFAALALVTSERPPVTPCGVCRQVLAEFAPALRLLLASTRGPHETVSLARLLPRAFRLR